MKIFEEKSSEKINEKFQENFLSKIPQNKIKISHNQFYSLLSSLNKLSRLYHALTPPSAVPKSTVIKAIFE